MLLLQFPLMTGQALLLAVFGAHALFDCLCTLATLFLHTQQAWACVDRLCGSFWESLAMAYPRMLLRERCGREDDLSRRLLAYYVASMSLARVAAVCAPCPPTFFCVAGVYALQALAAEYEGFSVCAAPPHTARIITCFCTLMGLCAGLTALTL